MRIKKIATSALIFLIIVFVFGFSWFWHEYNLPKNCLSPTTAFEVEKGSSVSSIARKLKNENIIKKKWPFLLAYKLFYSPQNLIAGEYRFHCSVSAKQALKKIINGEIILHPVTIPEGLTLKETADLLSQKYSMNKQKLIHQSQNTQLISSFDSEAEDLEGYLFPETYHLPKNTSEKEMISIMVSQFKAAFNQKWKQRAQDIDMTIREVVTLASLIEEETSVSEEKSLVSSVFHNRLNLGMKLDCDPTIIYALKKKEQYEGRLRNKDLQLNSPYNTYLYSGLPPSPISNPGKKSIRAALYPSKSSYLYFVSKNDGTHQFSSTFKEHQKAVIKYQINK
ncbi:MAG: endolytic transglycosylase MltG [Candidatus Aminicenantes bacterium]|nr:endolytic transglycosylase MltG [Candidatus Aminicenantes bacterium]